MSTPPTPNVSWSLRCVRTGVSYSGADPRLRSDAGEPLEVVHDFSSLDPAGLFDRLDARRAGKDVLDRSGVWRFRELVLPLASEHVVAKPEGNTNLYTSPAIASYAGVDALSLKHEGENPTGSFKDRGMTTAVSVAKSLGATAVACASTGNTSASMASYAAQAQMRGLVFLPAGKVSQGKLSQSTAYGARVIQIEGSFDDAMRIVEEACVHRGVYLVNSLNPYRVEGQKSIAFELLQDLNWAVPDWVVLPGGNLGNSSALAKGFMELLALGLIDRVPRLAVVQAAGANPLYRAWSTGQPFKPVTSPETLATAIRIGAPVSWRRVSAGLDALGGAVESVTDQEIMDAKAHVDAAGIGAEPASCATVAGVKKLIAAGVIKPHEQVCGVLTGHVLKDPSTVVSYHAGELDGIESRFSNQPVTCPAELDRALDAIDQRS